MTSPLTDVAKAAADQFPVRAYLANVTAVDTVAGECSVDIGDGNPLTGLLYLGPAVKVGAQVLLITFRRNAVVLGGTG
jgi:hypothetical protein